MNDKREVNITTRDRVLRAWENSMELVRDFKIYAEEIKDDPYIADMFSNFAKDEGMHASKFREVLHQYQGE